MIYRWVRLILAWLGAARYRSSEVVGRQSIAISLVAQRRFVLILAVVLALSVGAADAWLVPEIADAIDLGEAGRLFHSPSPDTLNQILQVIATASAGVIALVVTISMVTLQSTSERLGNRMVRFLMEEPVGRYVIDLLVLAFLLSLWGLFLSRPPDLEPIVTTTAAALLLSLGIATLVVYRDYALAFITPAHSARAIERHVREAIWRVSRAAVSPAVANYLQRRSANWTEGLRELASVLWKREDDQGLSEVVSALGAVLASYISLRARIPEDSNWFPTRMVPSTEQEGWLYYDMRRMMRSLGMGRPPKHERDPTWLEDSIFRVFSEIREVALAAQMTGTLTVLTFVLGNVAQRAANFEEEYCSAKAREELRLLGEAVNDDNLQTWSVNVINTYMDVVRAHLEGVNELQIPDAVKQLRWRSAIEVERLRIPAKRQTLLLNLQKELSLELTYSGKIVTPQQEIEAEIEAALEDIRSWHLSAIEEIGGTSVQIFRLAEGRGDKVAAGAWSFALLSVARFFHARRPGPQAREFANKILPGATNFYHSLPEEVKPDLVDAIEDLALIGILEGDNALIDSTTRALFSVLKPAPGDSMKVLVEANVRMLGVCAYIYLSAELDRDTERLEVLKRLLETFADPKKVVEGWHDLAQPQSSLAFGTGTQLINRYHDIWLDFQRRIEALPQTLEDHPGRMSLDYRADHPSELVRILSRFRGWNVAEVIEAMREWFKSV